MYHNITALVSTVHNPSPIFTQRMSSWKGEWIGPGEKALRWVAE